MHIKKEGRAKEKKELLMDKIRLAVASGWMEECTIGKKQGQTYGMDEGRAGQRTDWKKDGRVVGQTER